MKLENINEHTKNPPGSNFRNILKDPKLFRNIAKNINEKKKKEIIKIQF